MATQSITPPKPGIIVLDDPGTRVVTPTDPLVINETMVSFETVQIKGGDIIVNVQSTISIAKLEKVS